MHIISELQAGFDDAGNGTANIYQRGTTSSAVYYNDAEGLSPVAAGTVVALDSDGRAEVYVNVPVSVLVVDSAGTTIAEFDPMKSAPLVEVRSASFLGADYTTGAIAAGNPTTLQAIMDLFLVSFGATDLKVPVNGVDTLLKNAIASVVGLVYNVQDPTYGATGDGATDDRAAIQAAITAAAVTGGTVWFPGTANKYLTTAVLTLPYNVNLMGPGSASAAISIDHASADLLNTAGAVGATVASQFIMGLKLEAEQTNTGALLEFATTANCLVDNCYLGGTNSQPTTRLFGASTGTGSYTYRNCVFSPGDAGGNVHADAAACTTRFEGCSYVLGVFTRTANVSVGFGEYYMVDTEINGSVNAGTYTMIDLVSNTVSRATVTGSTLWGLSSATVTGIALPGLEGIAFSEAGNTMPDVVVPFSASFSDAGTPASTAEVTMGSRENGMEENSASGTTSSMDPAAFGNGYLRLTSTGAATHTVTLPLTAYPGARYTLTIRNEATTTLTTLNLTNALNYNSTVSVATLDVWAMGFVFVHTVAGTSVWMGLRDEP